MFNPVAVNTSAWSFPMMTQTISHPHLFDGISLDRVGSLRSNASRTGLLALLAGSSFIVGVSPVLADDQWTGQGVDSNWSTGNNWTSGAPNNTYGILYFNNQNNGKTTNTDDIGSLAQNQLRQPVKRWV